jgi:protease-4
MFSSFILKRILRDGKERNLRLLRILFQFIFLPIRLLYYSYIRLRQFFLKKKTILHWEFPSYFESANKSFLVRKIQGKNASIDRLELLLRIRSLRKFSHLKLLKIYLPPLEWTLGDIWEVAEELKILRHEYGLEIHGYAKEGSLGTLLLLAACNSVYLNQDAEFQIMLPSAEPTFYGAFLKQWGVDVEAYASGPFKSFAESFTRTSFSKEARSNIESLIHDLQDKIIKALITERKLKKESFYFPILTSEKLLNLGFAKEIISEDQFFSKEEKSTSIDDCTVFDKALDFRLFSKRRPILSIVPLSGGISGGEYTHRQRESGKIEAYSTISLLKELGEDKSVKAVILEINSPGGSAFHSELLYQEIKKLRESKPVIAYFKDTAASGGYYIGSATESITASPVCITGSIGAVMIRANLKKLFGKAKIQKESIGFYPLRDILSEYTPLKKESIDYLNTEIRRVEGQFYSRVKEGRGMNDHDLKVLGGGRVYLPSIETKVVDKLGGLLDTIDIIQGKFPKSRFLYCYELPEYNFRSEIPLLGRFTRNNIPTKMHQLLDFVESKWLDRSLYLLPIQILLKK